MCILYSSIDNCDSPSSLNLVIGTLDHVFNSTQSPQLTSFESSRNILVSSAMEERWELAPQQQQLQQNEGQLQSQNQEQGQQQQQEEEQHHTPQGEQQDQSAQQQEQLHQIQLQQGQQQSQQQEKNLNQPSQVTSGCSRPSNASVSETLVTVFTSQLSSQQSRPRASSFSTGEDCVFHI